MNSVRSLITALIIVLAGMGAWVWKTKEKQWEAEQAAAQAEASKEQALLAKDSEFRLTLDAKDREHQKDITDILEKHEKDLDALRTSERQRMAAAFSEFSNVLEGSKKTMDYLNILEEKVKSGQKVSEVEAQKLATIATGLTYLQHQYRKPFKEFGELETYLAKRAETNIETPNMRNAFWKRMFSRDFREQEREFYRTEGERRGFQEASEKFATAYASTQKQMAAVNSDFESSISKLNDLMAGRTAGEDLTEFFKDARKTLGTHQNLLEFEPPADPAKTLPDQVKP